MTQCNYNVVYWQADYRPCDASFGAPSVKWIAARGEPVTCRATARIYSAHHVQYGVIRIGVLESPRGL